MYTLKIDKMDDLKSKLSNLIENNKIDQAIKLLKEESAKRGGKLDHIIISLSSRYKRYKEKSLMGLESREQEFTKIVSDALELVNVLDNPSAVVRSEPETTSTQFRKEATYSKPSTPSGGGSNKYIQMGIGALAVIGLIALIVVFTDGGDDSGDSLNAYDDPYIESDANANQEGYVVAPDVYGNWRMIAQNLGPENDCPTCTIEIAQDGGSISISSNEGWYALLEYNSQEDVFQGLLNWGEMSPGDPEQGTELYWDENDNIIISTIIQGVAYDMTYAPN